MKGDFTRDTFDPTNHFSRVLMQQGRVTLDADHNEQTDILLHYLRTLVQDLVGPYAAPAGPNGGFALTLSGATLTISPGRYYVDGILVENDEVGGCPYTAQPDCPLPFADPLATELAKTGGGSGTFWVYLDVWERHITSIEDDDIREKALNGPDTCTRSQVVWQVKALPEAAGAARPANGCAAPIAGLLAITTSQLAARLNPGQQIQSPCVTAPDSQYRGAENQLYRVEIHNGTNSPSGGPVTFKWSRDNGSVAAQWLGLGTAAGDMLVSHSRGFEAGNWVEISGDAEDLYALPGVFVLLTKVQGNTLSADPSTIPAIAQFINPKVRRWDQTGNEDTALLNGAVPLTEGAWINLEDGIQVEFSGGGQYRTGDYWLIPARVATGGIEWPTQPDSTPQPLPPDGIEHHYAPLGFVPLPGGDIQTCACVFEPNNSCFTKGMNVVRPMGFDSRLLVAEQVATRKKAPVRKKH